MNFNEIIDILCHRKQVKDMSCGVMYGTIINILNIPIAIILGVCIIALVPKLKVLSYIGEDTLSIYLCHPIIQEVIRLFQTKIIYIKNDYLNYILSLIFVAIVLVILSSKIFRKIFNTFINTAKSICFKDQAKEEMNLNIQTK